MTPTKRKHVWKLGSDGASFGRSCRAEGRCDGQDSEGSSTCDLPVDTQVGLDEGNEEKSRRFIVSLEE